MEFQYTLKHSGYFETRRQQQQVEWMQECFDQLFKMEFHKLLFLQEKKSSLESDVLTKKITPQQAAQTLLKEFIYALRREKQS